MTTITRLFRPSRFNANVLTMLGGTSLAQAVPLAISPILTRLYAPEEFGTFALYGALAALLLIVGTGRYELAIILPKEDSEARGIVLLLSATSVTVAFVILAIVGVFSVDLAAVLKNPGIRFWLFLLPVSIVCSSAFLGFYYYQNRVGGFANMSSAQVQQTATTGLVNIGLGFWGYVSGGLILGTIAGQFASALLLIRRSRHEFATVRPDVRAIWQSAIKYRKFPALQLPATFVATMSLHAPTLLLSSFYGPAVVGMYALSQRAVRAPITVVGSAVGDVFRQEAGKQYVTSGNARQVFLDTFMKLILVSIIPFLAFILFAPSLFSLVFGGEWREAGEYARILAPMFWMSFVVSPLSNMFMIAEKQGTNLILSLMLITSSTGALYAGFRFGGSPETALMFFTLVYCTKYLVELSLSYRYATNQREYQ